MVAHLVGPAYEDGLTASQLQLELSGGAIYGVLFEGVRSRHTADLQRLAPFLTYFPPWHPSSAPKRPATSPTGRGRTGQAG